MSEQYNKYLEEHISNVKKAFEWMLENIPSSIGANVDLGPYLVSLKEQITQHDRSKIFSDEYEAYDEYFYGVDKTQTVNDNFNKAWLMHIHRNLHHWQYWVLVNDDPEEGDICIEIPLNYVVEMICDWWSFSWKSGDLYSIFTWYDEHKKYIKFHKYTRKLVESILEEIKTKLDGKGA